GLLVIQGELDNSGLITGNSFLFYLTSFSNSGAIEVNNDSAALIFAQDVITASNTGTIAARNGVLYISGEVDSLINSGELIADNGLIQINIPIEGKGRAVIAEYGSLSIGALFAE